ASRAPDDGATDPAPVGRPRSGRIPPLYSCFLDDPCFVSEPPATAPSPFMSEAFARVYEATAERITGPISEMALKAVGGVGPGMRVLDIAAGTGALCVPAARTGADVLGSDISPGMVARLAERLQPFPNAEARILDGAALDLPDGAFDLTFSVFG